MRKLVSLLLFIILFSSLSYNVFANFEISEDGVIPVNNTISIGESARYNIKIKNTESFTQHFTIDTRDFRWTLMSDPLSDYFSGFNIGPNDEKVVKLSLTPAGDLFHGIYRVLLDVKTDKGDHKTVNIPIEIKSPYTTTHEYAPVVIVDGTVNGNGRIDPRVMSTLEIELDNRNPLNISEMEVEVDSPFINESFTTSLGPLEKKKVEFNFKVASLEQPRVENIVITLRYNGNVIASTPKSIPVQIISYSQIIRDVNEDKGLLKSHKRITLKNKGNVDNRDSLKISSNLFNQIFTDADPEPKVIKEEGKKYLHWDIELQPGSSTVVDVEINYRPLFYVILVFVVSIILYFLMRSPVLVKKTAASINSYEGGISEMKILMHIQNRTSNTFNTFTITENIPKFATYLKAGMLGSIEPSKVLKHEKKGTLLKWEFDGIEPFEERIVIYKIKLNLTVLGRLKLPPTIVKFKDDTGGRYTVKSNVLKIKIGHEK